MARIETDPNYLAPTFSRATSGTDLFKKEDVQALAAAVSTHDHSTGKGVALTAGAIPNGTITSAMIADGTIVAGDIADGAVTSAKILDGTVATVDLANGAVTNAKLAADTARDNLLTNCGFEIWQRGAGPFATNLAFTADRWQILQVGAGDTISVSRDTGNVDVASQYCAAVTYTRSSGDTRLGEFDPETGLRLRGKTVTFSVRVKTGTPNAVRLRVGDGVTAAALSAYHTGSGTYETVSVTYSMATNGITLLTAVTFDQSCTAYLDNAMVVVGSVAADYAPLHPADDLARCLRYYELFGEGAQNIALQAYAAAGASIQMPVSYKARKAISPTVTKTGTWGVTNASQPTIPSPGVEVMYVSAVATALGMTQVYNNTSPAITIEANP